MVPKIIIILLFYILITPKINTAVSLDQAKIEDQNGLNYNVANRPFRPEKTFPEKLFIETFIKLAEIIDNVPLKVK